MNKKIILIFILLIIQSYCDAKKASSEENSFECDLVEENCEREFSEVRCCCNDTDEDDDDDDSCDDSCDTEERLTNSCSRTTTQRSSTTRSPSTTRSSSTTTRSSSTTTTRSPSTTTQETTTESTSTSTTPEFNFCEGIIFGRVPNPSNCSTYFHCELGRASLRSCNDNHIFDPENLNCIPGDPETCEVLQTTTESTTTTATPPNPCYGIILGRAPNPDDCSTYFQCIVGNPSLVSCDANKIFNPETLNCVPGDPETCEISGATTESTSTTTEFNICGEIEIGVVPNPFNCSTFFECDNGSASLRSCDEGQVFDPDMLICSPGNPETCEIFEVTTTTLSTTETTTTTSTTQNPTTTTTTTTEEPTTTTTSSTTTEFPKFYCQCPTDTTQSSILIPSPYFCNTYYECIYGVAYRRSCPDGLYFDAVTSTCIEPENAHCGQAIDCV